MANIEEKVENLLKQKIENIGYELYDVEYIKEGKNYFLRIFIDKPEGIDLQDCEKVNNEIMDLLDNADYIKEQYFLEVSSPGIERVLRKDKHLNANIGKEILIKLFRKDENMNKEYRGWLKEFNDEDITLEAFQNTKNSKNSKKNEKDENIKSNIIIKRKNIAQIKTIYNW